MAKKTSQKKAKTGPGTTAPVRKKASPSKAATTAKSKTRAATSSKRPVKAKAATTRGKAAASSRLTVKKSPSTARSSGGDTGGLIPPGGKGPINGRRMDLAAETKRAKTRLTDRELAEFRELLMDKRHELLGDMAHLRNDALRQGSSGEGGGSSAMPIHMADIGSDTWEQELTLGLIENERLLLREIDAALARIADKTYGICLGTNKPITKARLRAKPWAKYCIEYARQRELGLI